MYGEHGKAVAEANHSETAVIVGLSEIVNIIMEEHKVYPFTALMSDIGGAAGLFLGLNIMGLFKKILISINVRIQTCCKN